MRISHAHQVGSILRNEPSFAFTDVPKWLTRASKHRPGPRRRLFCGYGYQNDPTLYRNGNATTRPSRPEDSNRLTVTVVPGAAQAGLSCARAMAHFKDGE